jgi:hypothetical protein
LGLSPSQSSQLTGQGEGQHEIFGGYEQTALPFDPLFTFVVLAMRAQAVTTGMRDQPLFSTIRARCLVLRR